MKNTNKNSRAFGVATVVYVVLLVGVLILWNIFPIPSAMLENVLLGVIFFCIALITVVLFQSFRISESAQNLAVGLTKDMLIYSRDLFSELYRNSPVPYVLIDVHGHIESVNFATARLFHVEIDALNKLNVFNFFEGDDENKVALIPEYFRNDKYINNVELRIRRPDGSTPWVLVSLFPFLDANSQKKGLLTLVDITKQKQIDKAKTEFVSLASHQLRTPISSMKWNIELLMTAGTETLTELQREYIQKINRGLERMDLLVNDFLSVSKFELGTLTPSYAEVLMRPFIEGVGDEHAPNAAQKNIQLKLDFANDLGVIRTDTHLLHMITSNLISNAVKYTHEGGSVYVRSVREESRWIFTVTDTGMGIPAEEQEQLFTKMFRASNAKSQVTDGTGLGLYIVREAATVLGGKIVCESREGVGTTFTVTLPV